MLSDVGEVLKFYQARPARLADPGGVILGTFVNWSASAQGLGVAAAVSDGARPGVLV